MEVRTQSDAMPQWSPLELSRLRISTRQAQVLGALQSLPSSGAFVLDPALMAKIYDSQAVTAAIVERYEAREKAAETLAE